MNALQALIDGARQLAADPVGPVWETDGARACPIGWGDCSQPVFYSLAHDVYDYGERGGPADKHCRSECPHGYQAAPEEEECITSYERRQIEEGMSQ